MITHVLTPVLNIELEAANSSTSLQAFDYLYLTLLMKLMTQQNVQLTRIMTIFCSLQKLHTIK